MTSPTFCCEVCWRNPTCGNDCGSCSGPSIDELIARQDAPTVPVPKLPAPFATPIGPELAKAAYDRLEDPLEVRIYEHGLHIADSYAVTPWQVLEGMRDTGERMLGRTLYIVTEGQCYRAGPIDDNDVMPEPVPCDWCVVCQAEHRNCPLPDWCEACLASGHGLAECLERDEWEAAE